MDVMTEKDMSGTNWQIHKGMRTALRNSLFLGLLGAIVSSKNNQEVDGKW